MRGCSCRGTAGFVHVSCLAEQAKILFAEVEGTNLDEKAFNERWARWYKCSMCEQNYHGVVACALGWACWKSYAGRPERDGTRWNAMTQLGNALSAGNHHEDALSVREAELAMGRRVGAPEENMLVVQTNLASSYSQLGRLEEALQMDRDIYCRSVKLHGVEHFETLREAYNYASILNELKRFEVSKALLRKMIPVARRVLGDNDRLTLKMRWTYAMALYKAESATLDDIRAAVTTLEDAERTARRVFGGAHPNTMGIEGSLRDARAALRARETPSPG